MAQFLLQLVAGASVENLKEIKSGFTTYTKNNNVALDAVSSGVIFLTDHSLTSLLNLVFKTNLLYAWLVYLNFLHIDVIGRAMMNKG
jgi:hypothetical protein